MFSRILMTAALLLVSAERGLAAQDAPEAAVLQPVTTLDPEVPREQLRLMVRPLTKSELEVEAAAWFELLRGKARQIAAARLGVAKTNEALAANDDQAAQASLKTAETVTQSVDSAAAATEQQLIEAATKQLEDGNSAENADADDPASEPSEENDSGVIEGSEDDDPDRKESDEATDSTAANESAEGSDAGPTTEGTPSSQVIDSATAMKKELLVGVNELQDQRTALRDRLNIVLDSLETKGGEVQEFRQYAVAVSGLDIDTSDASSLWAGLIGWLSSQEGGQRMAWNLLKFAIILMATYAIGKVLAGVVNWLLERKVNLPQLAENLIARTIKNVVWLIGFVIALAALEVDVTPIAAAIGATGLVVGLALQGTLSNFASGLMILINRPFDVGNVVSAGGITGTIDEMNLVSTKFRTFDNQTIYIPNNEIWDNVITNITANPKRRVDLEFSIGYDDDFEQAEQLIRDVARSHALVYSDPEPEVVMHELADSSVNIICRSWADTANWWQVKTDIVREVKRRFDAAGITIPYPQQDVHIHQTPSDAKEPAAIGNA